MGVAGYKSSLQWGILSATRVAPPSLAADQRGLARHALPGSVLIDPHVREAPAPRKWLTVFDTFVAVDPVDDRGVAVDVDGHSVIVDLLALHAIAQGAGQKFLFVHQRAVVIDVRERICDQLFERGGVFALFRVIPGAL